MAADSALLVAPSQPASCFVLWLMADGSYSGSKKCAFARRSKNLTNNQAQLLNNQGDLEKGGLGCDFRMDISLLFVWKNCYILNKTETLRKRMKL
jgi:hypothetical protein